MTSSDLKRICGISKRRLQWWHEAKYIQGRPAAGKQLEWSAPAALAAAIFANLSYRHKRVFGVLAPQIRREARWFASQPTSDAYLVIDTAYRVRAIRRRQILSTYMSASCGLTLIPMSEIWEPIAASGGAR